MKNIYLILNVLIICSFCKAQNYELGLIHISDYNFKIVAIPDFDSSGDTDISDIGFTLMLPAGMDDIVGQLTELPGRTWNVTEFDAAFLTGLGLGNGTLDAFQFNMPAGQSLVAHTSGEMIDLVSFDVSNMPTSGELSFLLNSDPIAMGSGGVLDSFYNSNIDNTTTQDYFSGIAPGLDSFMFDTLSNEELEATVVLKIYPNPASEVIYISSISEIKKVELFDILGKFVMSSNDTQQLIIDHLSSGLYFVRIDVGQGILTKRIVIE